MGADRADERHVARVDGPSACLGENSMPANLAQELCNTLALSSDVVAALQEHPLKGSGIDSTIAQRLLSELATQIQLR